MRITPISELKEMDSGEPVRCVSGTFTSLYDRRSGTNDRGDWSLQRGNLKDHSGEIEILFKDHEPIPKNWRGKKVVLEAHKGDRGFTGLYAEDDTNRKTGKTSRIIKATKTAEVYLEGDEDARSEDGRRSDRDTNDDDRPPRRDREPEPPPRKESREREPDRRPPPAQLTSEQIQARALLDAKKAASRIGNLCCIAIDAVHAIVEPYYSTRYGAAMPEEQRQAFIGHILGDLHRDGAHIDLPIARLTDKASKTPPPAPEPPPAPPPPPKREPEPDDDEIPF